MAKEKRGWVVLTVATGDTTTMNSLIAQRSVHAVELDHVAVLDQAVLGLVLQVVLNVELGETPLAGQEDLLAAGELEAGTGQGLDHVWLVGLLGADRDQRLANLDTGNDTLWLAESVTHTRLETIGAGAGKHLVDAGHVERVHAHLQVETFLTAHLHQVLVAGDTGSLQSLGGQLLTLVRHQVDGAGELIYGRALGTQVINADLRIWYTTQVARLDVRLVLAVAVATSRTCPGKPNST